MAGDLLLSHQMIYRSIKHSFTDTNPVQFDMDKLRSDMEGKFRSLITQQKSIDSGEDEPIVLDEKLINTKVETATCVV